MTRDEIRLYAALRDAVATINDAHFNHAVPEFARAQILGELGEEFKEATREEEGRDGYSRRLHPSSLLTPAERFGDGGR